MFIRYVMVMMLLLHALPVAAQGKPAPLELSASAARALDSAFQAQYHGVRGFDGRGAVHVSPTAHGFQVRFDRAGAGAVLLNVAQDGTVRLASAQFVSTHEIVLPGPEAKGIAIAYDAWKSGAVGIPQTKADFDADQFTVMEQTNADTHAGRLGYYVTYAPPGSITTTQELNPLKCPAWAIYRVDPTTWAVFRQPPIC